MWFLTLIIGFLLGLFTGVKLTFNELGVKVSYKSEGDKGVTYKVTNVEKWGESDERTST